MQRIWKTSAFRHALRYAAMFVLSSVALCAVVMWSTTYFIENQIDNAVHSELEEVLSDADATAGPKDDLAQVVRGMTTHSGGFLYLLQDLNGHAIAGNMTAIRPLPGVRVLKRSHRYGTTNDELQIRGEGRLVQGGRYLFIGSTAHNVEELQEYVLRSFGWCVFPLLIFSLISGFLLSLQIEKRIEKITSAARAIMEGDLSQRIEHTKSHDEYDDLVDTLNEMLERISLLMTNLGQVTNDIAHDMRTPLSHLRQKLELAASGHVTDFDFEKSLADIDRILEAFSALLRIAQIESRSRRAGFANVDLRQILLILIEAYQVVAEGSSQNLEYQIIDKEIIIFGDHALLTQLFANLIENAIKHSGERADIKIIVLSEDGSVTVSICDNGPGIPSEEKSKIFERFYRLERSRTTPGSGLGLPTVAAIANLHCGKVEVLDSNPGTTIRVTLPR